jgi:hypothetical protein
VGSTNLSRSNRVGSNSFWPWEDFGFVRINGGLRMEKICVTGGKTKGGIRSFMLVVLNLDSGFS